MDFNYPDFLNEKAPFPPSAGQPQGRQNHVNGAHQNAGNNAQEPGMYGHVDTQSSGFRNPDFDKILHSKLAFLDQQQDTVSPLQNTLANSPRDAYSNYGAPFQSNYNHFGSPRFALNEAPVDSFNLPRELQGGIGNISSRRPSYAAESFTRSGPSYSAPQNQATSSNKQSLASLAAANNYSMNANKNAAYDQLADSFANVNLHSNFSEFQARRPSQLAEFSPSMSQQQDYYASQMPSVPPQMTQYQPFANPGASDQHAPPNYDGNVPINYNYQMKLDNKLMLKNQHILSSSELKNMYSSVTRYYQDRGICQDIVGKLKSLLNNASIVKMITFVKNLNNLNTSHKMLCLVVNKNGKLDLLSYPNNSNIYLQIGDMVIVDGDRGKDLVMVLEPLVSLNMAILFNFLKKIEHLRSLTITDSHGGSSVKNSHWSGTHATTVDASTIVNSHSNEDNEFIINLPTKQVLRFATPKEIQKLSGKFLEEKKAFVTCFNKIKELGLSNDLTLVNVEYQFDLKKLIFYYFAGFKRIDFRDLIKELFKIYKTRIWLCAVLPYDKPELYTKNKVGISDASIATGRIPKEYDLTTEQIMTFSIEDFKKIPSPSYFHSRNMANLIDNLEEDVKGYFYGFNSYLSAGEGTDSRRRSYSIQPSFNPFGETEKNI